MPQVDRSKPSRPVTRPTPKKVYDDDDDEDDVPVAKPKKRAPVEDDDDDDEPVALPKKKKAPVVDDDDEDEDDELTNLRSKKSAPAPASKKPVAPGTSHVGKSKSTGSGWGALANKQKEADANQKRIEENANKLRPLKIKGGETAQIQFLADEPYCLNGHSVKDTRGYWGFQPCQLENQKHCLMCADGIKTTWKAVFPVLDYRGTWDKNLNGAGKGGFKNDKPVERALEASATMAGMIQAISEKRGKLTDFVYDLGRTGNGAKDTVYSLELARDDDDKKIPAQKYKSKHDLSDEYQPLDDEALNAMGFEGGD